jgi:hypothetical protein
MGSINYADYLLLLLLNPSKYTRLIESGATKPRWMYTKLAARGCIAQPHYGARAVASEGGS